MDMKLCKNILTKLLMETSFIEKLEIGELNDYLSVTCTDSSKFYLQIHEMEFSSILLNNELQKDYLDEEVEHYMNEHTKKDFLNDLDHYISHNPQSYRIFAVLWKLNELKIISKNSLNQIMDKLEL